MATQYHVLMAFARTPEVVLVAIQVMYDTSGRVIHVQEKPSLRLMPTIICKMIQSSAQAQKAAFHPCPVHKQNIR
jgi:hypothetical protein